MQLHGAQRPRRRWHRSQSGAAAVEFGLIAPVLVLLVFGIISFGILFAQTLALDNAARQGARFGAVGGRTCSQVVTEARAAAQTINVNTASVSVKILRGQSLATAADITSAVPCSNTAPTPSSPCWGSAAGDNIYVQTTYQSKLLVPLFLISNNFTVGGTGAFKCEYTN